MHHSVGGTYDNDNNNAVAYSAATAAVTAHILLLYGSQSVCAPSLSLELRVRVCKC